MRGITEERLIAALEMSCEPFRMDVLNWLIDECKELNPWQPIETAPKDRRILLFASVPVIGWYDDRNNVWRSTDSKKLYATHWQELPEDPK